MDETHGHVVAFRSQLHVFEYCGSDVRSAYPSARQPVVGVHSGFKDTIRGLEAVHSAERASPGAVDTASLSRRIRRDRRESQSCSNAVLGYDGWCMRVLP